jgi:two-component system phosphate regulon response regulator PhoB
MGKEKILIVDDEEDIVELIRYNLEKEGYRIVCAYSGEEALRFTRGELPQLIVLDLMLPGMNGLEVYHILRKEPRTAEIPIIMLTARGKERDIVTGLELGADDYITKPFRLKELIARIRAVLRRSSLLPLTEAMASKKEVIVAGDIAINTIRHEATLRDTPLMLTLTEFNLLKTLASHPSRVFTRKELLDKAWGEEKIVFERTVDVHIRRLRQKLGNASDYITTVRGVGYLFKVE